MKSFKRYFGLFLTVWICMHILFGQIILNEIKLDFNNNSEQLHSAVSNTDLTYYTWGGNGSESAYDIARDSSNNIYIVGLTDSFGAGSSDFCVLKLNSFGELEWNKIYGGLYSDWGTSIAIDSQDNIYVTGFTNSYGAGGKDIWVLKFNSIGGLEWNYTWGGIGNEYGWSIALDSKNNAYIAGYTNSFGAGGFDICLLKFNSSGLVWNYTCGGINDDEAYGVSLDLLDNVYVVGSTESFGMGKADLFLVKFDSSGMIWNKTWGCADRDQGTEIICSPSGDLYVAGYHEKWGSCSEPAWFGPVPQYISLIKFTSDGIYQWNNTWDESTHAYTYAMDMDSSGNTYIAGYTNPELNNDYDMCLIRFNSSGKADWSCIWGGSESELTQGVVLGPNGTAYVVGNTQSYSKGFSDLCMVEFKIGQCPYKPPPNGIPFFIPGYQIIILIGITLAISMLLMRSYLHLKKVKFFFKNS